MNRQDLRLTVREAAYAVASIWCSLQPRAPAPREPDLVLLCVQHVIGDGADEAARERAVRACADDPWRDMKVPVATMTGNSPGRTSACDQ
jgi:hypothetical protein